VLEGDHPRPTEWRTEDGGGHGVSWGMEHGGRHQVQVQAAGCGLYVRASVVASSDEKAGLTWFNARSLLQ
jgi:hypothetical protein